MILPGALTGIGTVSLADYPGLELERPCVQNCLGGANVVNNLECANVDSCICRADIRPAASSYLQSCIETYFTTCSGGPDYTNAVSIYDRYCNFTAPATVVVTQTSGATWSNQPKTITTFTAPPTATVTVQSSSATFVLGEWYLAVTLAGLAVFFTSWS
ncbi:hypothetical protein K458DRAFT_295937 [Lentithecium fluviatile CBS 122367]|uniref:Extracellular membrane protein CFEM domain-containing protein n=1 Tax=Lentithecium fluviatile CBS 122367 TaxID=1168545 RepID=A0A6G1JBB3_9PLEO|nr:hypothetical protein K458DRAFT_295937 [Lentithecium fluviatile CBS 122367]